MQVILLCNPTMRTQTGICSKATTYSQHTDLEYAPSASGYINKCIGDVTVSKTVHTGKWKMVDEKSVQKCVYCWGPMMLSSNQEKSAHRGLICPMASEKQSVHLGAGSSAISVTLETQCTGLKGRASRPSLTSLPDVLNDFCAWFDATSNTLARKTIPSQMTRCCLCLKPPSEKPR